MEFLGNWVIFNVSVSGKTSRVLVAHGIIDIYPVSYRARIQWAGSGCTYDRQRSVCVVVRVVGVAVGVVVRMCVLPVDNISVMKQNHVRLVH